MRVALLLSEHVLHGHMGLAVALWLLPGEVALAKWWGDGGGVSGAG